MDDPPSSSSTPNRSAYSADPTLYLYTSLTAGSSHIITATSRIETILKANKIPFRGLDVATDEKARMLWGRRAGKRKLPGLVKMGMVVGDLEEIEDWNEYGELHEKIGEVRVPAATPSGSVTATPTNTPSKAVTPMAAVSEDKPKGAVGGVATPFTLAMRQAGEEAAKKAAEGKSLKAAGSTEAKASTTSPETKTPALAAAKEPPETPRKIVSADKAIVVPKPTTAGESSLPSSPTLAEGMSMHRGSTVSPASKEEIRDIEAREAIPEEDEEEEESSDDSSSEDEEEEEEQPTIKSPTTTKPPTILKPQAAKKYDEESPSESEDEESSEEEEEEKPNPRPKPTTTKPPHPKPEETSDSESESESESDEEDEDQQAKPPTKSTATMHPKPQETAGDSSTTDEDEDDEDDTNKEPPKTKPPPLSPPKSPTATATPAAAAAAVPATKAGASKS